MRHHLLGQQVQMLQLVKDRVQQQVLRASPHEFAQLVSALRATSPDGHARGHVGVLVAQAKPLAQATLCALDKPKRASGTCPPIPTPTVSRPWLSWSRLDKLLANCTGLRKTVSNTEVPRRSLEVSAAA